MNVVATGVEVDGNVADEVVNESVVEWEYDVVNEFIVEGKSSSSTRFITTGSFSSTDNGNDSFLGEIYSLFLLTNKLK